jgi:hypothetical protein
VADITAAHRKWMAVLRLTHINYTDAELQKEAMDRALADLDKIDRKATEA